MGVNRGQAVHVRYLDKDFGLVEVEKFGKLVNHKVRWDRFENAAPSPTRRRIQNPVAWGAYKAHSSRSLAGQAKAKLGDKRGGWHDLVLGDSYAHINAGRRGDLVQVRYLDDTYALAVGRHGNQVKVKWDRLDDPMTYTPDSRKDMYQRANKYQSRLAGDIDTTAPAIPLQAPSEPKARDYYRETGRARPDGDPKQPLTYEHDVRDAWSSRNYGSKPAPAPTPPPATPTPTPTPTPQAPTPTPTPTPTTPSPTPTTPTPTPTTPSPTPSTPTPTPTTPTTQAPATPSTTPSTGVRYRRPTKGDVAGISVVTDTFDTSDGGKIDVGWYKGGAKPSTKIKVVTHTDKYGDKTTVAMVQGDLSDQDWADPDKVIGEAVRTTVGGLDLDNTTWTPATPTPTPTPQAPSPTTYGIPDADGRASSVVTPPRHTDTQSIAVFATDKGSAIEVGEFLYDGNVVPDTRYVKHRDPSTGSISTTYVRRDAGWTDGQWDDPAFLVEEAIQHDLAAGRTWPMGLTPNTTWTQTSKGNWTPATTPTPTPGGGGTAATPETFSYDPSNPILRDNRKSVYSISEGTRFDISGRRDDPNVTTFTTSEGGTIEVAPILDSTGGNTLKDWWWVTHTNSRGEFWDTAVARGDSAATEDQWKDPQAAIQQALHETKDFGIDVDNDTWQLAGAGDAATPGGTAATPETFSFDPNNPIFRDDRKGYTNGTKGHTWDAFPRDEDNVTTFTTSEGGTIEVAHVLESDGTVDKGWWLVNHTNSSGEFWSLPVQRADTNATEDQWTDPETAIQQAIHEAVSRIGIDPDNDTWQRAGAATDTSTPGPVRTPQTDDGTARPTFWRSAATEYPNTRDAKFTVSSTDSDGNKVTRGVAYVGKPTAGSSLDDDKPDRRIVAFKDTNGRWVSTAFDRPDTSPDDVNDITDAEWNDPAFVVDYARETLYDTAPGATTSGLLRDDTFEVADSTATPDIRDTATVADSATATGSVLVRNGKVNDNAVITGAATRDEDERASVYISGGEVKENARVSGTKPEATTIADNAVVSGAAGVEDSSVRGNAVAKGRATIADGSNISGDAVVDGDAVIMDSEISGDAVVAGQAVVENKGKVMGRAQVNDDANINGGAVKDQAEVRGDAVIKDGSEVRDKAKVNGRAQVINNGRVVDQAQVGGRTIVDGSLVKDDAKVKGRTTMTNRSEVSDKAEVDGGILDATEVTDEARVAGNAQLKDSKVKGNSEVRGKAKVGNSTLSSLTVGEGDDARDIPSRVLDDASVTDSSIVGTRVEESAVVNGSTLRNVEVRDFAVVDDLTLTPVTRDMATIGGNAEVRGNQDFTLARIDDTTTASLWRNKDGTWSAVVRVQGEEYGAKTQAYTAASEGDVALLVKKDHPTLDWTPGDPSDAEVRDALSTLMAGASGGSLNDGTYTDKWGRDFSGADFADDIVEAYDVLGEDLPDGWTVDSDGKLSLPDGDYDAFAREATQKIGEAQALGGDAPYGPPEGVQKADSVTASFKLRNDGTKVYSAKDLANIANITHSGQEKRILAGLRARGLTDAEYQSPVSSVLSMQRGFLGTGSRLGGPQRVIGEIFGAPSSAYHGLDFYSDEDADYKRLDGQLENLAQWFPSIANASTPEGRREAYKEILKAIYEIQQEQLAELGIDPDDRIEFFRGVSGEQYKVWKDGGKSDILIGSPYVNLATRPGTAASYSDGEVLRLDVRAADIFTLDAHGVGGESWIINRADLGGIPVSGFADDVDARGGSYKPTPPRPTLLEGLDADGSGKGTDVRDMVKEYMTDGVRGGFKMKVGTMSRPRSRWKGNGQLRRDVSTKIQNAINSGDLAPDVEVTRDSKGDIVLVIPRLNKSETKEDAFKRMFQPLIAQAQADAAAKAAAEAAAAAAPRDLSIDDGYRVPLKKLRSIPDGIDPSADIGDNVKIGNGAAIGPTAVIADAAEVSADARVAGRISGNAKVSGSAEIPEWTTITGNGVVRTNRDFVSFDVGGGHRTAGGKGSVATVYRTANGDWEGIVVHDAPGEDGADRPDEVFGPGGFQDVTTEILRIHKGRQPAFPRAARGIRSGSPRAVRDTSSAGGHQKGKIASSASVDSASTLDATAVIADNALVTNSMLGKNSTIGDGAKVTDTVLHDGSIRGTAVVTDSKVTDSKIGDATLVDKADITGGSDIGDNAFVRSSGPRSVIDASAVGGSAYVDGSTVRSGVVEGDSIVEFSNIDHSTVNITSDGASTTARVSKSNVTDSVIRGEDIAVDNASITSDTVVWGKGITIGDANGNPVNVAGAVIGDDAHIVYDDHYMVLSTSAGPEATVYRTLDGGWAGWQHRDLSKKVVHDDDSVIVRAPGQLEVLARIDERSGGAIRPNAVTTRPPLPFTVQAAYGSLIERGEAGEALADIVAYDFEMRRYDGADLAADLVDAHETLGIPLPSEWTDGDGNLTSLATITTADGKLSQTETADYISDVLDRAENFVPDSTPSSPDSPASAARSLTTYDPDYTPRVPGDSSYNPRDPRSGSPMLDAHPDFLEHQARIDAATKQAAADGMTVRLSSQERRQVIDSFVNDPKLRSDGKMVYIAGTPGAGKGYLLSTQTARDTLGIDPDEYLFINSDTVRERIAELGLLPDFSEYGLAPGETGGLVHQQAVDIVTALASEGGARKLNMIFDASLMTEGQFQWRLGDANRATPDGSNYDATLVFVDVDIYTAMARAMDRYYQGDSRYTPLDIISGQAGFGKKTVNRENYDKIKQKWGGRAILFDSSGEPQLLEDTFA